jgi:hypothetical protein
MRHFPDDRPAISLGGIIIGTLDRGGRRGEAGRKYEDQYCREKINIIATFTEHLGSLRLGYEDERTARGERSLPHHS